MKVNKLSVVILTKDNPEKLLKAFNSITKQTLNSIELDVVIMDTGSNFDSKMMIKKWFQKLIPLCYPYSQSLYNGSFNKITFRYYTGFEYNFSLNNNYAVENLIDEDSANILFMNNDVYLESDFILSKMLFLLYAASDIGTVGSKLIFPNTGLIQHNGISLKKVHNDKKQFLKYQLGHVDMNQQNIKPDKKAILWHRGVFGNTGALLMIKRKLFNTIGGFKKYESIFQDVHLNIDCLKEDKVNVCMDSGLVYHDESSTRSLEKNDIKQQKEKADYIKLNEVLLQNVELIDIYAERVII